MLIDPNTDGAGAATIEQGYFVFTLMPTLRCRLNCPHCYLSLDERRNSPMLPLEQFEQVCRKVDAYYRERGTRNPTIVCYYYGGEPLQMPRGYCEGLVEIIERVLSRDAGYNLRHVVLSSLIGVGEEELSFVDRIGDGYIQTSYDGRMRGKGYVRQWEKSVQRVRDYGLRFGTISVVNRTLLEDGPRETMDYLADLGVAECSFLPFMLNLENQGEQYDKYAPWMREYSEFMKAVTARYFERRAAEQHVPEIGQMRFILDHENTHPLGNLAGQTLFLMPGGDFVLPDYKGYMEFMQPFGNILDSTFEQILKSPARRAYMRRQLRRNANEDCQNCPHTQRCIMEFWKPNRPDDDCFGAREYIDWLLRHERADRGMRAASALF